VQPDVRLKKPDRSLHVMRRRLKDADVYLLFNEGPEAFSQRVVLQRKGKRVEKWDATTGKVAEVKVSAKARDVFTELALKPYEMCVLVVR
jgi:hypothetical protein